jgi:hypothetical protein
MIVSTFNLLSIAGRGLEALWTVAESSCPFFKKYCLCLSVFVCRDSHTARPLPGSLSLQVDGWTGLADGLAPSFPKSTSLQGEGRPKCP